MEPALEKELEKFDGSLIKLIFSYYFKALLEGYCSLEKKLVRTSRQFPGSNIIEYYEGDWAVIDMYYKFPESRKSSGSTTVIHKNQTLWVMSYQGWYERRAIPFLKDALRASAKMYGVNDIFNCNGCRGPDGYEDNIFTYSNRWTGFNFEFGGREEIFGPNNKYMGYHKYFSQILPEYPRREA